MTKNNHIRKVEWFLDSIAQKLECLILQNLIFWGYDYIFNSENLCDGRTIYFFFVTIFSF